MRSRPPDPRSFDALPLFSWRLLFAGGAILVAAILPGPNEAFPAGQPDPRDAARAAAAKPQPAKPQPAKPQPGKRTLVTLRGEVVDYYCFIEKGARGPGHRECGMMCVAGDVCMGLYTTDDRLFMISINHMRAMQPRAWSGVPDPFQACRKLIAETVDLTGYAMERKGQRIIEVTDVKPVVKTAAVAR